MRLKHCLNDSFIRKWVLVKSTWHLDYCAPWTLCLLCKFSCFFLVCWSFQNQLFRKVLSGIPPECETVLIQIRPDVLSGLTWVQTVCKGYQQTALVGKALWSSRSVLSQVSSTISKKTVNYSLYYFNGRHLNDIFCIEIWITFHPNVHHFEMSGCGTTICQYCSDVHLRS